MVKSIRAGIKKWNIKKKLRQVVQWDDQGAKTSQQIIKLYRHKTEQQEKTPKYVTVVGSFH